MLWISLPECNMLLQDDLYGGDIYDTVAEPVLPAPAATMPADDSSRSQVAMPETDVAFLCASQQCYLCFTVSAMMQVPVKVQEPTPMEDDTPARYLVRALHLCALATDSLSTCVVYSTPAKCIACTSSVPAFLCAPCRTEAPTSSIGELQVS